MHARGCEAKRTLSETNGRYKTVRERCVAIGLDESASFLLVWLRIRLMDGPRGRNIVGMRIGSLIPQLSISSLEFAHTRIGDLPDREIAADKKFKIVTFFALSNFSTKFLPHAQISFIFSSFLIALIYSY